MTINTSSAIHRTAFVGTCFLIGAAALTACGEGSGDVATVYAAPPAYVSPEQVDHAAQLAVQADHVSANAIERRAPSYVSPEQTDRAAQLAVQAEHVPAVTLERRAVESTSAHASAEDFERRGVESPGAQASVDALERLTIIVPTSAHASADALEHWALSDGGN